MTVDERKTAVKSGDDLETSEDPGTQYSVKASSG
jgi:hypothetical protein